MKSFQALFFLLIVPQLVAAEYRNPCDEYANKYEQYSCLDAESQRLKSELEAVKNRFPQKFEEMRSVGPDQGNNLEAWLAKTSYAFDQYVEELCGLRIQMTGAAIGSGAGIGFQRCELYLTNDRIRHLEAVLAE